jgi:glycosyltransferase involved in cell wall biosynthesis
MKIGFDISQTGALKAGCGYFAESLIRTLTEIDGQNEYVLYPAFGTGFWDPDHKRATWHTGRQHVRRGPEGMSHAACVAMWQSGGTELDLAIGAPDVVHANNYFCPRGLTARVVYTLYDLVTLDHPDFTTEANRLVCTDGLVDASVHADMLIAISEATRSRFLELFPHYPGSRVKTVYPASRFTPEQRPGRPPGGLKTDTFWLAVGTVEPRKNLRRLVRAYAALVREHPTTGPLVIAGGTGWLEEDFNAFVRDTGVSDRIQRLGYVSDEQLAALYAGCFAFVYPSLVEGFGMPVLEAMSLGAAVITSNRSSMPEIVSDTGFTVDPEDEAALAAAMSLLQTEAPLRARLRDAARLRATRFSWVDSAQMVLDTYKEVLNLPSLHTGLMSDVR